MARKRPQNAPNAQQSALLLPGLDQESPAPAPPPVRVSRVPTSEAPLADLTRACAPAVPLPSPVEGSPRDHMVVSLEVKDQYWSAHGAFISADGEVLDDFEASGVVTADGCAHSGWVLAASEAMRKWIAMGREASLEINIPADAPVGFLVVTLPARAQAATWDESIRKLPWPSLYQEFLDLKAKTNPRIRFARA